jgi:hypothetical protein
MELKNDRYGHYSNALRCIVKNTLAKSDKLRKSKIQYKSYLAHLSFNQGRKTQLDMWHAWGEEKCKGFVGKPERKRSFGRSKHRQ